MIRGIAKLLRVLNSETEPGQISLGFCLSMIAGFTPFYSLHNLLVLFLLLAIRVNISAFILGLAFFSAIGYILDPLFHSIGLYMLTMDSLQGLWTSLYNSMIWRIERFNNTVVMGSLVSSLAFVVPLYIVSNLAIMRYREHVLKWVEKTRLMQAFKATRFYHIYRSLSGWEKVS